MSEEAEVLYDVVEGEVCSVCDTPNREDKMNNGWMKLSDLKRKTSGLFFVWLDYSLYGHKLHVAFIRDQGVYVGYTNYEEHTLYVKPVLKSEFPEEEN